MTLKEWHACGTHPSDEAPLERHRSAPASSVHDASIRAAILSRLSLWTMEYGMKPFAIAGGVHCEDHTARNVHSLVMRAKVLGFRFCMEGDTLRATPAQDVACIESSLVFKSI